MSLTGASSSNVNRFGDARDGGRGEDLGALVLGGAENGGRGYPGKRPVGAGSPWMSSTLLSPLIIALAVAVEGDAGGGESGRRDRPLPACRRRSSR